MFGLIKAKAGGYILVAVASLIAFLVWEKVRLENKVAQIVSESAVFEQAAIANEAALMVYSASVNEEIETYRINNDVLNEFITFNTQKELNAIDAYNEVNLNDMPPGDAINLINSEYERLRLDIQKASHTNKGDRHGKDRTITGPGKT